MKKIQNMTLLAALVFGLTASLAHAEVRSFRLDAVEIDGVKFWLPSTLVVKKGDTVKISATSKVPGANSVHGLEIKEFKVLEVVNEKGKSVEFKADKAGVFTIDCQLHPAHVGAQLVVLE